MLRWPLITFTWRGFKPACWAALRAEGRKLWELTQLMQIRTTYLVKATWAPLTLIGSGPGKGRQSLFWGGAYLAPGFQPLAGGLKKAAQPRCNGSRFGTNQMSARSKGSP